MVGIRPIPFIIFDGGGIELAKVDCVKPPYVIFAPYIKVFELNVVESDIIFVD